MFKTMLLAVEEAQLEGRIHNRCDALQLIKEQFPTGQPWPAIS